MKTLTAFFCITLMVVLTLTPVASAQYVCQRAPQSPAEITGSINAGDVQQAAHVGRDHRLRPRCFDGLELALEHGA